MVRRNLLQHKLILGLMLALVLVGVGSLPGLAAEGKESMTLSPTDRRFELDAGETVSSDFTILNDGETAYDFIVYASPYSIDSEAYDPNFEKTPANADAYKWVNFEKTSWHVEPRQSAKVPFTMRVAKDAAPGGHYGVIFAEMRAKGEGSVARNKRLGLVLYTTVNGDVKMGGKVSDIKTSWYQGQPPVVSTVMIENSGNTHFTSKQSVVIKNVFGKVLHTQDVDTTVLPGKPRAVDFSWKGAAWLGLYSVKTSASALDDSRTKESYVLVAPVWFLFTIVVFVAAGVVYAIRGAKRR